MLEKLKFITGPKEVCNCTEVSWRIESAGSRECEALASVLLN